MCEIIISRHTTRNYNYNTGAPVDKDSGNLPFTRSKIFPNGPRRESAFTGILCSPELAVQIMYRHKRKRLQGNPVT